MRPNLRSSTPPPLIAGALAFGLALALGASPAQALITATAANTTIQNTATVAFKDAGGVAQTAVVATANVTVNLVQSGPNISASTPASPVASTPGSTVTLTYTITSTANGPDTYNLSTGDTQTNISGSTATPSPTSIALGASSLALAYAAGGSSITVPWDGSSTVDTTAINGLHVGSIIVIGGSTCTITSINKSASSHSGASDASNVAVIGISTTVGGGGACGSAAANSIVPEQKTVTVSVVTGTLVTGNSGTDVVTLNGAGSTGGTGPTGSSPATTVNVTRPALTVLKEVQADPGGVGGTCTGSFGASANGPPGSFLCYRITVTNGGAGSATSVQITDVVPQFVSYVASSGKFTQTGGTAYSAATGLTDATDADGYTFTAASSTVLYAPASPGPGTVPAAGVLILFFRATIN